MGRPPTDPKVRFIRYVRRDGGCLRWTGSFFRDGYGQFRWNHDGKLNWRAHRAAWTLFIGPIPEEMQVLHSCDHSWCVDYEKCLYLGDHARNMEDRHLAGRYARGQANPNSKLTHEVVAAARQRLGGTETQAAVARALGIGRSNITNIAHTRTWKV